MNSKKKNNKKVTMNSKYYRERQRTCNNFIIFKYLIYLVMDWEIFNELPALEQVSLEPFRHLRWVFCQN